MTSAISMSSTICLAIFAATFLCVHADLFTNNDPVTQLTRVNFKATVHGARSVWMVVFYVKKCSACKKYKNDYVKFANDVKGSYTPRT